MVKFVRYGRDRRYFGLNILSPEQLENKRSPKKKNALIR